MPIEQLSKITCDAEGCDQELIIPATLDAEKTIKEQGWTTNNLYDPMRTFCPAHSPNEPV